MVIFLIAEADVQVNQFPTGNSVSHTSQNSADINRNGATLFRKTLNTWILSE